MMARRLTVVLAALLLGACGFHLRGGAALPAEWQPLFLQNQASSPELVQQLRRELELRGAQFTDDAGHAQTRLAIRHLREDQRTLSLDEEARVSRYALTLSAELALLHAQGQAATKTQTLQVRRVLSNDPDNPVGTSSEASLIRREMRGELAQRIADQLLLWQEQMDQP